MQGSTVLVIDDHPLCAAAVSAALSKNNPGQKVISCASLKELGTLRVDRAEIILVLLDLMLPDATGMSGVKVVKSLFPEAPICVISSRTDTATVRQALSQDIVGFLPKTLAFDQMTDALARVLKGEAVFPRLASSLTEDAGPLSPAEQRIMQALSLGLPNKQIAYDLGLAESTVKSHLARIFSKLHVTNRSQAILAYEAAIAEDDVQAS
jgi:DNA-binding NarL/FixJ family response regulator